MEVRELPKNCDCALNEQGRGHWSACALSPESLISSWREPAFYMREWPITPEAWCAWYHALDKQYNEAPLSPLHHDNRCELHR